MSGIVRLSYDGKTLPAELASFRPRFLLEAIPEILGLETKEEALRLPDFDRPIDPARFKISGFGGQGVILLGVWSRRVAAWHV